MPVDALAKSDGVSARKGEARNGEAVLKEGTRTYESFQHHASALSKLPAKEQERWKKARARRYSALARQRRSDREQDLRNQVGSRAFSGPGRGGAGCGTAPLA
jgi:hypothetical protein